MSKYLELFRNAFDNSIDAKTKPENKPYIGYSLTEDKLVYTVIPKPVAGPADNEIWYTTVDNTPIWSNGHAMNLFMCGDENNIVNNSYNTCGILTCKNPIKVFNGHENAYASYFSTYLLNDTEGFEDGLPEGWFESSEVTSIILPEGVESINFGAFAQMNNLESITIPKSVTKIGEQVFSNSPMLKTINYNGSKEDWYKIDFLYGSYDDLMPGTIIHCVDGDIKIKDPAFPDSIAYPADNEIWYTTTDGSFINFKDVMGITGNSTLSDTMSFEQSTQGEYIVARFSENISSIGGILMGDTFYEDGYKLACIALPSSIESTNGAFSTCINLTNVINPPVGLFIDSNSNESCFENTNIKEFVIPINATCIPWACFSRCYSLKSITIPNSVTLIKGYAFKSCESLNSINFEGTMEQWNAIEKGENWNLSCLTITVHCTDGDITIPSTN